MRKRARTIGVVVTLSVACAGCAVWDEDELPPVRLQPAFNEPDGCVAPPPPPMLPPLDAPSDPRACLPASWSARGLPVQVSVVDGRVASFELYDQCSGDSFEVDAAVRECISQSLSTWGYAVWPTCRGEASRSWDVLHLFPLPSTGRASREVQRGCTG